MGLGFFDLAYGEAALAADLITAFFCAIFGRASGQRTIKNGLKTRLKKHIFHLGKPRALARAHFHKREG